LHGLSEAEAKSLVREKARARVSPPGSPGKKSLGGTRLFFTPDAIRGYPNASSEEEQQQWMKKRCELKKSSDEGLYTLDASTTFGPPGVEWSDLASDIEESLIQNIARLHFIHMREHGCIGKVCVSSAGGYLEAIATEINRWVACYWECKSSAIALHSTPAFPSNRFLQEWVSQKRAEEKPRC
jgi:hypothetical protein